MTYVFIAGWISGIIACAVIRPLRWWVALPVCFLIYWFGARLVGVDVP